jgi:hypothetical protein
MTTTNLRILIRVAARCLRAGVCLCCAALCVACSNPDKQAAPRLAAARTLFEQGDLAGAKHAIDSIKTLFPKAFDVRRQGIALMQEVELKEQERCLTYLDSLLQVKDDSLQLLRPRFTLEKDTAYQQTGRYLAPSQVIERNLHRSFLRFQTDERGVMSMTSIYCGTGGIHHTAVRVSAPDGTFAQTPPSPDSYETTDLGEHIEKADYKLGQDGGVIGFLYLNRKAKNIRLQFLGDRTFSTTMTAADLSAAAAVFELSRLLDAITRIKEAQEEAHLKIGFIQKNMERRLEKT